MARLVALVAIVVGTLAGPVSASPPNFPRRLLFVGNPNTPRTKSFVDLLKKHFVEVRVAKREGFDPSLANDADVVLLDWSQGEAKFPNDPSPFGDRKSWKKPTVFLGSAGLLVAVQWQIIGGSG